MKKEKRQANLSSIIWDLNNQYLDTIIDILRILRTSSFHNTGWKNVLSDHTSHIV